MGRRSFNRKWGYNANMAEWERMNQNDTVYMFYYTLLKSLAIVMYKWNGLPPTVDRRFLELTLFEDGNSLFFNDEIAGFISLKCVLSGNFNLYGIPNNRMAYSVNGYTESFTDNDSVIIWSNYLHSTMHIYIDMFARRLTNCTRTIDININGQKTPMIIVASDEKKKLALEQTYADYTGNAPVLFAYNNFNMDDLKYVETIAPFIADKVSIEKNRIWSEAMMFLGINNTNIDKKERMISDEANGNLEQILMCRMIGLNARRMACDEINQMFNLNISVDYNDEIQQVYNKMFETDNESEPIEESEEDNG